MEYEKEWTDSSRTFVTKILVFDIVFTLIDMIGRYRTEKGLKIHEVRPTADKWAVIPSAELLATNRKEIGKSGLTIIGTDCLVLPAVHLFPTISLAIYGIALYYYLFPNTYKMWFKVRSEQIKGMNLLLTKYPLQYRLRWMSYGFSIVLYYIKYFAIGFYYSMVWTQWLPIIPYLPFALSVIASIGLSYYLGKKEWRYQETIQNDTQMAERERLEMLGIWDLN